MAFFSFHSLSHRTVHAVGFFVMKIIVLYKGFNAMLESVQIILFTSVSGITDRHVWVSAVK